MFPRRASAIALGLLGGLLALEAWARWAVDPPRAGSVPATEVDLGWTSAEFDALDPSCCPRDQRYRLLVLGDSYLTRCQLYESQGQDRRFPIRLERNRPDRLVTGVLATPGWGTQQQLLAFLQKGVPWQPDRVLLCVCINNDLLDISTATQGEGSWKPYFVLGEQGLRGFDGLGRPIALAPAAPARGGSALWAWIDQRRADAGWKVSEARAQLDPRYLAWSGHESPTTALLSQLPPSLDLAVHLGPDLVNGFTREPFEWNQYQWRLLGALLGELRQQVERSGAELSVMLLPTAISPLEPRFLIGSGLVHRMDTPEGPFTLDLEVPRERLGQLCAAAGVEFVDPCAEFLQLASRPQTFPRIFPDPNNRHWSAEGHGLLALILEPTVDRWLQSPPSRLTRRSGAAVSPPSSESASATAPPHPRPAGRGSDGPRD